MYKVLLVDDEPFISEGLSDAVDWSAFGLEIVGSAEDGEEALERLRQVPADILITDISMPVMDGLELIRQARSFLPHLKVIILSGFNEFGYLKEGMRLGIENYLLKPIRFEELEATLVGTVDKLNAGKPERVFGKDEIGILRDNVMTRWISGRIAPPELAERTALLGIDLTKPYAAIAIIRLSDDSGEAYEAAERLLERAGEFLRFHDADGSMVIVFCMDDAEHGKGIAVKALGNLAKAWESRNSRIRIALGSVQPMAETGKSYEQARKAQQYFLVMPDLHFVDYGQLPSASPSFPKDLLDWETYAKSIMAKDKAELLGRIGSDFAAIRAAEGMNPARTKSAAVELIIRMKMEADKLNRADSTEAYKDALDKAMAAATLEGVEDAVKEVSLYAIDSFSGEDMSPVIKQVLRYIQEHYAEALTLKTLGQQYHIHPNYLGQLFHKQTGDTFADYINKFRIDKAKALLIDSRLKVNEIAKQVGYWEIGYFYKQFKKHVGIVPSEYKGLQ
ncbi:response regulator transcription factor [Cohnella luojiensis]|uniref:Response regulator transcription factor n=1 Tax=Cohnella luojiensis TaxID=652876 RepID=A0A4Y8LXU3_9BACL|nr:response regulator transcription factor [Cohnella luojiensis]TFE25569.1 response regulator transcription factor [Cohnella luojiensis]